MRHLVILTALTLSTACQPAPKTQTSTEGAESSAAPAGLSSQDEAAIRAVDAEWARAATAGDANALTATYSSDATLLPPNEPVVKGEAVKKYNADMLGAFSGPEELTTMVVEGRGDVAYAVGTYRATLTPKKAGAKPLPTEEGKYLEVLKKQPDGSWKIVYDMWSSNAPAGKP
jgi:ketosteroid isomerase-like protein